MTDKPDTATLVKAYWVPALLALILCVLLALFRAQLGIQFDQKTILVLGGAAAVIYLYARTLQKNLAALKRDRAAGAAAALQGGRPPDDATRYVVAFDAFVGVVAGLGVTILACQQWQTAALLGGASLFLGGFVGLLFGYPQGVAQQQGSIQAASAQQVPTTTTTGPPAPTNTAAQSVATTTAQAAAPTTTQPTATTTAVPAAPTPVQQAAGQTQQGATASTSPVNSAVVTSANHGKNLVAESAATLGKVIAGFSLAKSDSALGLFKNACSTIGPALGANIPTSANVVAGVIISYFALTGFLSGLFLPSYFMRDQL